MGELFILISVMMFTIVVAWGCLAAGRGIMEKREKIIEGWLHKSGGH